MERTRSSADQPFAPISLARAVLYAWGAGAPAAVDPELGTNRIALRVEEASSNDGLLDRLWPRRPPTVIFERDLRSYDFSAFNTATLPSYAKDWRSAMSQTAR